MKEKYEAPEMEIVAINEEGIIFASGGGCGDVSGPAGEC